MNAVNLDGCTWPIPVQSALGTTKDGLGVFAGDLDAGELRRNGVKVRVQDLPFRTLALLLARPGVVITREEFRQALWPADVVMRLRESARRLRR